MEFDSAEQWHDVRSKGSSRHRAPLRIRKATRNATQRRRKDVRSGIQWAFESAIVFKSESPTKDVKSVCGYLSYEGVRKDAVFVIGKCEIPAKDETAFGGYRFTFFCCVGEGTVRRASEAANRGAQLQDWYACPPCCCDATLAVCPNHTHTVVTRRPR